MILMELHEGIFNDPQVAKGRHHGGWRLLVHAGSDDIDACSFLAAPDEFEERDFNDFLALMFFIFEVAKNPDPLEKTLNVKQMHDLGDITFKIGKRSKKTKLFEFIKRQTAIRVVFCYAGGVKIILLTQVFLKREAKFPSSQRAIASGIISNFFESVEDNTARLINAQGGRPGFEALYGRGKS